MASAKSWMLHVSTGVIAVAAIAFGCVQCSGRKKAEQEKNGSNRNYVSVVADNRKYGYMVDSLQNENLRKSSRISELADTVHYRDVEIQNLRDSVRVLGGDLNKCRQGKKQGTKKSQPKVQPKIQPKPQPKDTCRCDTVVKPQPEYRKPKGYIKVTTYYNSR